MVSPEDFPHPALDVSAPASSQQKAVLAGGCFWCVEAVYLQLAGVSAVTSGYAGGTAETADYETVCSGTTDHAEVVQITFDPARITFGELLRVFFSIAHDPTQRDRQGGDLGKQYRSAIFYVNDEQKSVAEAYIKQIDEAHIFGSPVATEVVPLEVFYEAETYHHDYASRNAFSPYIMLNAKPKVAKVRKHYADRLKQK